MKMEWSNKIPTYYLCNIKKSLSKFMGFQRIRIYSPVRLTWFYFKFAMCLIYCKLWWFTSSKFSPKRNLCFGYFTPYYFFRRNCIEMKMAWSRISANNFWNIRIQKYGRNWRKVGICNYFVFWKLLLLQALRYRIREFEQPAGLRLPVSVCNIGAQPLSGNVDLSLA